MTKNRAERRKLRAKHNPYAALLREKEYQPKKVETKEREGARNLLKDYEEGRLNDI